MNNNKKLKLLIGILFCFIIILVALLIYAKTVYNKSDSAAADTTISASNQTGKSSEEEISQTSPSNVKETIDLKLYFYDAEDYDNVKEIRTVKIDKTLYETDITTAINQVLSGTNLKINKAVINGNSITVDLSKEVALKFNSGSAGGITYTNILAMTILNLPNLEKLEVTVDGVAGVEADHFTFNGVFNKGENGKKYNFVASDKESKPLDF